MCRIASDLVSDSGHVLQTCGNMVEEHEAPFKHPIQNNKNIFDLKGEENVPASVEKIFAFVGKSLSGGPIERK